MYKQGRRFAEGSSSKVTAFDLAAMQAQSYLGAINALSLVEKRNAWIALPTSTRPTRVCHLTERTSEWQLMGRWPRDGESLPTYPRRNGPKTIDRLIS